MHHDLFPDRTIIPVPAAIRYSGDVFMFNKGTQILINHVQDEVSYVANRLVEWVHAATGYRPHIRFDDDTSSGNVIKLQLTGNYPGSYHEEYSLKIKHEHMIISATEPAGLIHAFQSLRQLFPADFENQNGASSLPCVVPCVEIRDYPRYHWRGMLLDCSRHFVDVDRIHKLLELLAYHKLNVFHWHLVDDQGWRLEIKKYPKLTEVGAWRVKDDVRHGGFYTQKQVREVVAHAAQLGIMVIPEIEFPGHSSAAIAAYPHLSCSGEAAEVPTRWGVFKDILCAGKDDVITFLEDVLEEVVELFPAPYIHIGGDEAPRDRWDACPHCQQRMESEHLKFSRELQTWMTRRIQSFLELKNRSIIGWDELWEGGLPPGSILQHWRFEDCLEGALNEGHQVISSPHRFVYLNYPHDKDPALYIRDTETMHWMPALGTEKVYSYEPEPENLSEDKVPLIIGGECTLWTEFIPQEEIHSYLFPRLCAFSEVLWSPQEVRNWIQFRHRIAVHLPKLQAMGVSPYMGPEAPASWQQIYPEKPPVDRLTDSGVGV